MFRSWFGRVWNETHKISSDFAQRGDQGGHAGQRNKQPARQASLEMCEGIGSVDLVRTLLKPRNRLGRLQNGQRMQIVSQHLGPEVLLCREPTQTRRILQRQAMLEAFKCLLDPPSVTMTRNHRSRSVKCASPRETRSTAPTSSVSFRSCRSPCSG